MPRAFAERLRELRKAKGYTQNELAEAVGLTRRMVNFYERKTANPPLTLLARFADVLGVGVEELIGEQTSAAVAEAPPENLRLWRKLRRVEQLPENDRKLVVEMVDRLLSHQRLKKG